MNKGFNEEKGYAVTCGCGDNCGGLLASNIGQLVIFTSKKEAKKFKNETFEIEEARKMDIVEVSIKKVISK